MVIIDEVQRLKNWNTQIARAARKIISHYAVILSGTPLENRLEELYSVVQLVDQFCLSPYYLFRDQYGGYMIPKAALGDRENEFRRFVEEKTGKKFIRRWTPLRRLMNCLRKRENEPEHL